MEEFYNGFAQRARDLAEKADPFTRRRLLDLAQRYELKSRPGSSRTALAAHARDPTDGALLRLRRSLIPGPLSRYAKHGFRAISRSTRRCRAAE